MENEVFEEASHLQHHIEQITENLKYLESQIQELEDFLSNIDFFNKSQEKEMFSSLGKGVHVKSELKSKDLYIEVGAGVVVKKNSQEAKKIIESQIKKLKEARLELLSHLESHQAQLEEFLENKINKV